MVDKDGEELQEVMIKDISYNEQQSATVVTLLDGFKHRFENGDQIVIKEVQGMAKLEGEGAINELICTVTVLNPQSFKIDIDSREYGPYEGNGIAKQIKVPKKAQFKSLEELETENTPAFDENLLISDFEKLDHKKISHYVYEACISMQGEVLDSYDSVELGRVLTEMVTALVPADLKETEK